MGGKQKDEDEEEDWGSIINEKETVYGLFRVNSLTSLCIDIKTASDSMSPCQQRSLYPEF